MMRPRRRGRDGRSGPSGTLDIYQPAGLSGTLSGWQLPVFTMTIIVKIGRVIAFRSAGVARMKRFHPSLLGSLSRPSVPSCLARAGCQGLVSLHAGPPVLRVVLKLPTFFTLDEARDLLITYLSLTTRRFSNLIQFAG
jgi:hypothetical protein